MKRVIFGLLCAIFCIVFQYADASPTEQKKFQYELSIVSLFRDEARFLKEWIEFHKMMGVQHFYLYNHLSQDDYMSVLQPYIDEGVVELGQLVKDPETYQDWHSLQNKCYNDTLKKARTITRWLAIIDTDEFIIPAKDKNLVEMLKRYQSFGGLMINWQMYGTSDVEEIPQDKLMIEMLSKRAEDDYSFHYFFKSIIQPLRTLEVKTAHRCIYKRPYFAVNSNFDSFDKVSHMHCILKKVVIDRVRINHYWTRDELFFNGVKTSRVQQWDFKQKIERLKKAKQLNDVEDPIMDQFVPKLRKRMGFDT